MPRRYRTRNYNGFDSGYTLTGILYLLINTAVFPERTYEIKTSCRFGNLEGWQYTSCLEMNTGTYSLVYKVNDLIQSVSDAIPHHVNQSRNSRPWMIYKTGIPNSNPTPITRTSSSPSPTFRPFSSRHTPTAPNRSTLSSHHTRNPSPNASVPSHPSSSPP